MGEIKAKRNIILVVISVSFVLLSRQCLVFSLYIYSEVVSWGALAQIKYIYKHDSWKLYS